MTRLAVVNTKTNRVQVFDDRTCIADATFNVMPEEEDIEAMRVNPDAFLGNVPHDLAGCGVTPTDFSTTVRRTQ